MPKRTLRANGKTYHIFKPSNSRGVQNWYKDKTSMDMALKEIKLRNFTFWKEKQKPLTIDMKEDNYTGRYRPGLSSLFVPVKNAFKYPIDECLS